MNPEKQQLAYDVLTNALESSAIRYWADNLEWKRVADQDDSDDLDITDISLECVDEPGVVRHLGATEIIEAMGKIAVDESMRINPHLRERIAIMLGESDYLAGAGGDAESDDVICQVAAFGEIIYG